MNELTNYSWYNLTNISNGNYSYYVFCNDTAGNTGNTSRNWVKFSYFVITDTTPPNLTWVSPTDINVTIEDRNSSYFNLTTSEAVENCTLQLFGVNNYSMFYKSNTSWYINLTNFGNYNYTYQATCNDTSGNIGNSSINWISFSYYIFVDTTPPNITWEFPTDINVTNTSRNWTYANISTSEAVINCTLELNYSINYSMNYGSNTSFYINLTNLINGNYSYYSFCNDTSGNVGNSTRIWFAVDISVELGRAPHVAIGLIGAIPTFTITIFFFFRRRYR